MRSPATRPSAGLTLLEVMLAATLLSVVFIAIYGIVWSTLATRDSIERATLPHAVGPAVMAALCDDLRMALVEPYKDFDAFHAEVESTGGEDTTFVDFVAATSSRARYEVDDEWVRSSITEVGYRCRRSESRDNLLALYRREDFGVDGKPLEGGKYYKLVDGVKEFRIEFFEEDPGEQPTSDAIDDAALEEWDAKDQKGLPWACRVRLVIEGEGETDDRGVLVEEPQEFTFVRWVVFPTRYQE